MMRWPNNLGRWHCYIVIYMFMKHHNDTIIKTDARRKTSFEKYIPLTLLQGFERVVHGLRVRGSWRPNITEIFWPQSYGCQRCVFLVLQGCLNRGPGPTLLGLGFLYCILSASSLDPKLHQGSRGPLWPGVAFLTTSRPTPTGTRTELNCCLDCVI